MAWEELFKFVITKLPDFTGLLLCIAVLLYLLLRSWRRINELTRIIIERKHCDDDDEHERV